MASEDSSRPDFHVDVLLYQEDDQWVGHCLQLDLVEAGATRQEAQEHIVDVGSRFRFTPSSRYGLVAESRPPFILSQRVSEQGEIVGQDPCVPSPAWLSPRRHQGRSTV